MTNGVGFINDTGWSLTWDVFKVYFYVISDGFCDVEV